MIDRPKKITGRFYASAAGRRPVREWLLERLKDEKEGLGLHRPQRDVRRIPRQGGSARRDRGRRDQGSHRRPDQGCDEQAGPEQDGDGGTHAYEPPSTRPFARSEEFVGDARYPAPRGDGGGKDVEGGVGVTPSFEDGAYLTNSRIALSMPSRVSGYIRPPMSCRMMRIDWVKSHSCSATGLSHTQAG
jgi:hypothetical protein